MVITKIDSFVVLYSANTFAPRIWLFAKGNGIGQLVFERDNAALPPDSQVGGQVNLFYHLEQFPHALNLLESDSQVSLLWNGTGTGNENALLTAPENVTDEQIHTMMKHPRPRPTRRAETPFVMLLFSAQDETWFRHPFRVAEPTRM